MYPGPSGETGFWGRRSCLRMSGQNAYIVPVSLFFRKTICLSYCISQCLLSRRAIKVMGNCTSSHENVPACVAIVRRDGQLSSRLLTS